MSVRRACVHPRLVNDFGTVRVFWQGDMNVLCQPKGQRGLEIYDLNIVLVLLSKWLLKHLTTDGRSTWQQLLLNNKYTIQGQIYSISNVVT